MADAAASRKPVNEREREREAPNVIGFTQNQQPNNEPTSNPSSRNLPGLTGIKKPDPDLAHKRGVTGKENPVAEQLLLVVAQLRKLTNRNELRYFAANEFKSLVRCDQILIHEPARRSAIGKISTVTGIAAPDANAPLLIWLQDEISMHVHASQQSLEDTQAGSSERQHSDVFQFRLDGEDAPGGTFGLPCALTILLRDHQENFKGAITFLSRRTLDASQVSVANWITEAYGHAEQQFVSSSFAWLKGRFRLVSLSILLLCALLMVVPVPLTVLAPVTIAAHQPQVITAPLSGVIDVITVSPNAEVVVGDLLFTYDATEWQNQYDLAEKNVTIAEARFKRANQDAFSAAEGRRELAVAKAELALAVAEKNAAARRLSLVEVRANKPGLILFESREKWQGRPVTTGERVMRIADLEQTRFAIDLSVDDSIILEKDAPVKVFLDADPLNPIDAELTRTSYVAEISDRDQLVFPLRARAVEEANAGMRIGLKGTAQIYGEHVPLWFYLFRKPLSFLRQFFGL